MGYILNDGRYIVSKEPPHGDEGYTWEDYFDYNYKAFDCTKKDAFNYAFECMLGIGYCGIESALKSAYNIKSNSYFTEYRLNEDGSTAPVDPLKKYSDKYAKFDGKMFDSILETIFNVSPDHNYVMPCDWESVSTYAYFYEGNYYILRNDGGDIACPKVEIDAMKLKDDGRYFFRIEYLYGNDDCGYEKVANLEVIAGLVEWNGSRVWSLYSISKI